MQKNIMKKTLIGSLSLTLIACGGGNGSSNNGLDTSLSNQSPVASAGVDQNLLTNQTVLLDGSSSYDPDNDEIAYEWSFLETPLGSQSTLDNSNVVKPTFIPDLDGVYQLSLRVYDGKEFSMSDDVKITVTTANSIPVANAGSDQSVSTQSSVILDGSNSYDADSDNLTYSWLLEARPNGSNTQLSNSNSVKPTFSPDVDGEYILKLVVNDGTDDSIADSVIITANTANSAPIANAGLDRNVNTYQLVSLNGSNSSDANGDTLSYQWSFVSKPDDSSSVLNNSNSEFTDFTPDIDGQYTISLVVNDGQASSNADNVVITSTTANSTPIANAGTDKVQFDLNEATLDASASSDADGDNLIYQWSIKSAPIGSGVGLANANSVLATFTPDLIGDYVFTLTVNDGSVDSSPDNILLQVLDPAEKQNYLANNINAYTRSASSSSVNGYVQSGSQYTLNVTNNNSQSVNWLKFEAINADGGVFASTTDSSVLSGGSLIANESSNISMTLQSSQRSPFKAIFYWSDPLDGNKTFQTTLEFANR